MTLSREQTKKGEKYKRVFVHFEYWYNTEEAQKAKARLEEGKELKIVYDDPWFWKVSINKVNTNPRQRINLLSKPKHSNPRIDFEADDTKVLTNQSYEKEKPWTKGNTNANSARALSNSTNCASATSKRKKKPEKNMNRSLKIKIDQQRKNRRSQLKTEK